MLIESLSEHGRSHVGLLGELDLSEFSSVGHHVLVLDAHNTTAPVSSECLVLVELSTEVLSKELEILVVLLADFSECDACSGLGVHELAKASLALDEGIGDTLLAAESWEEDEQLNGVDIVSHHNELGLALLNQLGNVVETELDQDGLGGFLGVSTSGLSFGFGLKSGLLLLLSLRLVLGQ